MPHLYFFLTMLAHKSFGLLHSLQLNFIIEVVLTSLVLRRPKPPSFLGKQTLSQARRWILWSLYVPPQMKFLHLASIASQTDLGREVVCMI